MLVVCQHVVHRPRVLPRLKSLVAVSGSCNGPCTSLNRIRLEFTKHCNQNHRISTRRTRPNAIRDPIAIAEDGAFLRTVRWVCDATQ